MVFQRRSRIHGGDYDPDKPIPYEHQDVNQALQAKASTIPPFPPGMTLFEYRDEYPNLTSDQIMTAYGAMVNRTSFKDPGQANSSLRTPTEVATDTVRQKKVAQAFIGALNSEVANEVTNDALNNIHQGVQAVAPILPDGASVVADASSVATDGLAHLLNLPADMSINAGAERIAEATEKAEKGGGMKGGSLDDYLPDISYANILSASDKEALVTALINMSANHYGSIPASNPEKQQWSARFSSQYRFAPTLPYTASKLDAVLPEPSVMQEAFGHEPDMLQTLANNMITNAIAVTQQDIKADSNWAKTELPPLQERINEYHTMFGGSGLKKSDNKNMPVRRGQDSQGAFYRYGNSGKKYYYEMSNKRSRIQAKAKAEKQQRAVHADK
jgi:hypothetical protein